MTSRILSDYMSIRDMILLGRITKIPSYEFITDANHNSIDKRTITLLKIRDASIEIIEVYSRCLFLVNPFSENINRILAHATFAPTSRLMKRTSVIVTGNEFNKTITEKVCYYSDGETSSDISRKILKKIDNVHYTDSDQYHYIKTSDGSCIIIIHGINYIIEINELRDIVRVSGGYHGNELTGNMEEALVIQERYLKSHISVDD